MFSNTRFLYLGGWCGINSVGYELLPEHALDMGTLNGINLLAQQQGLHYWADVHPSHAASRSLAIWCRGPPISIVLRAAWMPSSALGLSGPEGRLGRQVRTRCSSKVPRGGSGDCAEHRGGGFGRFARGARTCLLGGCPRHLRHLRVGTCFATSRTRCTRVPRELRPRQPRWALSGSSSRSQLTALGLAVILRQAAEMPSPVSHYGRRCPRPIA